MRYLITVSLIIFVYISGGCGSLISSKTTKLDDTSWKAQSLAQKKITPYTIESLSPENHLELTSRIDQQDEIDERFKNELSILKKKVPDAFDLITHDKNKNREVWIYTSYKYDNYVWAPGYWVAVSENGRLDKYYTGLTVTSPYVLLINSNLPTAFDGQVKIVGRKKELAQESITFPAMGLTFIEDKEYFALVFKIEDLKLDKDGDGLTDLEEERLLTDPNNKDTDGDGIEDDDDVNALSSEVIPQSDKGKIYSLVLKDIYPRENVERLNGLVMIVGEDNFDIRGLNIKLLILSPQEFDQYRKKFGFKHSSKITLGKYIEDLEKDPQRLLGKFDPYIEGEEKAIVSFSEQWFGKYYEAEKIDGEWKLKMIGSWIT